MEPNRWPLDQFSAAELVARAIMDIERNSDEHRDLLISDLLWAAWGSALAQDH